MELVTQYEHCERYPKTQIHFRKYWWVPDKIWYY
jgi:hypothetical protein